MKIEANNPDEYISKAPEDRQEALSRIRKIMNENLPKGFSEVMIYNMIGFVVPHETYSDGYHCDTSLPLPFINIGNQKNFIALYHMGLYATPAVHDWFVSEYPKHCKRKLDMGKSCIRFKKMDDIPYDLIAELAKKFTVEDWISTYEKAFKK